MLKKTFRVPDMTCSNCVMRLEGLEDDLEGVREIKASYHRLEMIVEFDEKKISEEHILAAVIRMGYHPEAV